MQILGIRNSVNEIRYAIVEWDGANATLVNADDETKLKFPPAITDQAAKLIWAKTELERVLRNYPDIDSVIIKANEFSRQGGDSSNARQSAYLDAVAQVVAAEHPKPVDVRTYRNKSLASKAAQAKGDAEARVGASSKYWNNQMADAVLAAYSGRE